VNLNFLTKESSLPDQPSEPPHHGLPAVASQEPLRVERLFLHGILPVPPHQIFGDGGMASWCGGESVLKKRLFKRRHESL